MQIDSAASHSDDGYQRLLTCSEPGERSEKDDLKATSTPSRDGRYRTINVLVKLPIGVSVLGRVCSLCMSEMESLDCGRGSHTTMGPDVLFPLFKGAPFFPPGDKAQETVSDMLVGTYGKEYTLYQWCGGQPGSRAGGWGNCGPLAWAVVVR